MHHPCSVANGDRWLSRFLPKVIASDTYRSGRTAIFITWDEDDYYHSNRVLTLAVAPTVKPGLRVGARFNHYSLLHTIESMLGLKCLKNACKAPSMRRAFNL
jgi:hypothetical protein